MQLTCSDEEDAGAEEDGVGLVVDSARPDTQPAEHQQDAIYMDLCSPAHPPAISSSPLQGFTLSTSQSN
ncbi:hypothetical protein EYF80_020457 [Liparis tanakae]|uniref:Uncharacterized protein n=1 Tax=Liparis tanakae TaxID=230148 RepID=A0A4Z2HTY5_9TELE|nr:hypothetical protein EYF80_020457 [Liparis tanakae]